MPSALLHIETKQYVYFASDFHFGIPNMEASRAREKEICAWLNEVKTNGSHLFLMGDIFDTWLEYKSVIPKGHIRFLGKLAELSDAGIEIYFFTGNHDLWTRNFFPNELNIQVVHTHETIEINRKKIHLGHGDGIGPGDKKYKMLKAILRNGFCQFLYRQFHPDLGIRLASYFSQQGPKHKYDKLEFLGKDKEFQVLYANDYLLREHIDYFIFGHRHIPNQFALSSKSEFINLGDWLSYKTYARFGQKMELLTFNQNGE